MSDRHERTEKPTPKRRKEARQRGQVARSAELTSWGGLLVALFVGPALARGAGSALLGLVARALSLPAEPSPGAALGLLGSGLWLVFRFALSLGVVVACVGVALGVAQVGLRVSWKAVRPTWSRISPVTGLKRIAGPAGVWELVRTLLKLGLLSFLAARTVSGVLHLAEAPALLPAAAVAQTTATGALAMMRAVAAGGLALGAADYLAQRRRVGGQLRMTRREVKEEARRSDGDPTTKGAQRRRMTRMSRMRMLAEVARADVVLVNPTHVSVALHYDASRRSAPRVVAKGADEVAWRIRAEARRHGVPVVADPGLARALYQAVELGEEIPQALYVAVARVLAFVYNLTPDLRSAVEVHPGPAA